MKLEYRASSVKNARIINRLQVEIGKILGPLIDCKRMTVVDFPDHSNVGDSAIWLGEKAYFDKLADTQVRQVRKQNLTDRDVSNLGGGVLCIHGGGNFGDLWPRHQKFRESLMQRFPQIPIVQLPQSIHFQDPKNIDAAAGAIAAHGNVTLLVRDAASLELARTRFDCRSELCPDMAFCIGAVARTCDPSIDILGILRQDKEAVAPIANVPLADRIRVEDWIGDERWGLKLARLQGALRSAPAFDRENVRRSVYNSLARARLNRGVRQLSRARAVVTDRLHAHIICVLMGIPHAVLDNSYGKIAGFMDAFGTDQADVHVASSLSDAAAWASERIAGSLD